MTEEAEGDNLAEDTHVGRAEIDMVYSWCKRKKFIEWLVDGSAGKGACCESLAT